MAFYVLTRVKGPAWDASRDRREQDAWDAHAAFMDALVDAGFVLLGGPVGDGEDVLLVVEAPDAQTVLARLAADPWETMDLLRTGEIRPWTLWLDGRLTAAVRV